MTIDVLGVGLELPYDLTAADDAEKWEQDLSSLNQTLQEIEERGNRRDEKMAGRSVWPGIRCKGI